MFESLNQILSFWEKEMLNRPFDCIVVGGGIVGCNAAITIQNGKPNWRIAIVDKSFLPFGASSKNAGFATFGSISEILSDAEKIGFDNAINLIKKRWVGLQSLIGKIGEKELQLNWTGGHEVFLEKDRHRYEACLRFLPTLNNALHKNLNLKEAFFLNHQKFGMSCQHIISNKFEGVLHPGEMMQALRNLTRRKGIEFIGAFNVQKHIENGDGFDLVNENGVSLNTNRIVYTTNGYTNSVLPNLNVLPARNQVILTNQINDLKLFGAFHYNEGYMYWRNVGNCVLLGGARNIDLEGETTDQSGESKIIQEVLKTFLKEHILPNNKFIISHKWSGIMGVGASKEPIVKEINPHIFAAVRLGGMGVAIGTLVGEEVAKLVITS